jgi:TrmH family RNA methyltransferase
VIAAALDRGVPLHECFVEAGAGGEVRAVAERAAASGIEMRTLSAGSAARVSDTQHPQPILAVAPMRRVGSEGVAGADLALVAARVGDPGNAGTMMRGAAAAGAQVIVLGAGSVDAYNPKVVRASAGACFAVRVVEDCAAVDILAMLRSQGVSCLGASARDGRPPEEIDLRAPTAFVVGNETQGLDPALPLDGTVTLPMVAGESMNAAMAGTVLLFEAARQRRRSGPARRAESGHP